MARQAVTVLLIVIAFGILVPWYKGLDFFDPIMIVSYSSLALLFVAPASTQASTGRGMTLRRMGIVLAYGWGIAVLILASGIVTVNLTNRHGGFLSPPASLCGAALALSLTASASLVLIGGLLSRFLSPNTARLVFRLAFFALLLAVAFGKRHLPPEWQEWLDSQMTTAGITRDVWFCAAAFAVLAVALLGVLLIQKGARESYTPQQ